MKNLAVLSTVVAGALAFLLVAKPASADQTNCNGQYGQYSSCVTQSILIDKTVSKATSTGGVAADQEYVDNLSSTDPRFKPGQVVYFKLRVKNTSNIKQTNVTVKDFVPSYVDPIEGPGSFDSNTRTITFNAGDFNPDEEKIYYVKMQFLTQDKLPADFGLQCIVNKAQAYNDQVSDDDTAQFCVEKQVVGTPNVPATGPEFGLLALGIESAALAAGFFLRKKV